jgi:hypothetical protein
VRAGDPLARAAQESNAKVKSSNDLMRSKMMSTINCPGCGSLLEVDDDGGYCEECDNWYELADFEDEDEDYMDYDCKRRSR